MTPRTTRQAYRGPASAQPAMSPPFHRRMRMPARNLTWVTLTVLLSLPASSAAQSFNGAILGVVRDSSGAVVPEAAVTLRNVATDQIVATAVSGPEGAYAFRNLAPAKYEV